MKLIDTINTFIPGDWGSDSFSEETSHEVLCIRGADIVPISNSEFTNIPLRYICERAFETKCLEVGDIVIEKSGGSPTQSTGRVTFISEELMKVVGRPIVCSNFCVAFRVKEEWNPLYVYYYIQHIYNADVFFNFEGKTSGIKNLQLEVAFQSIPIKKTSLEEQNKIVKILHVLNKKINLNLAINQNLPKLDHSLKVEEVRHVA